MNRPVTSRDTRPPLARRPRSPAEILEPAKAPSRPSSFGKPQRRPPNPLHGFLRTLSTLLTILLVLMATTAALVLLMMHLYERPGPLESSRVISIPKGENRIGIAERLEREGVIANRWTFIASHLLQSQIFNRLSGTEKNFELKFGEYEFKKAASMRDVLEIIAKGESLLQKITIPEGLTSQQIVERLRADEALSGEIAEIPPEGSLLPETYRFSKGTARQDLIDRMRTTQRKQIAALWEKRQPNLPIATLEDGIILASIIEKETGRADERERVASVFVNRLRKRMRLQSDPTIIYGIVGGQGPLGRPILRSDIKQKTPYNTYHIYGLPPTPICNPGLSAIEATFNPANTKDIYFVADGKGGHTFSATLDAHNAAVAVWRKAEKEMRAREGKPDDPDDPPETAQALDGEPDPDAATETPATVANPVGDDGPDPDDASAKAVAGPKAQAASIPLPIRKPKR